MPKSKDKRDLYEKCWGCDGTRKLVRAAHIDETRTKARNAQPGEPCPLCEDGYFVTGITMGQFEAIVRERDTLLVALFENTPGIADKYRHHLTGAKDRLASRKAD